MSPRSAMNTEKFDFEERRIRMLLYVSNEELVKKILNQEKTIHEMRLQYHREL